MPLSAGSTFLLRIRIGWVDHLWILLADRDVDGKALMVNITSAKPHSDRTTVLQVGDHPFITRESVVNYGDAVLTDILHLEKAITSGLGTQREDVSAELLERLRSGLLASPRTKNSLKDYLRNHLPQRD